MCITSVDVYSKLIYLFLISYFQQISIVGTVRVGSRYNIYPFLSDADPTNGVVYIKILNKNGSIRDLNRFISNNFEIPNFESTEIVVITFYKIPGKISHSLSIVSY